MDGRARPPYGSRRSRGRPDIASARRVRATQRSAGLRLRISSFRAYDTARAGGRDRRRGLHRLARRGRADRPRGRRARPRQPRHRQAGDRPGGRAATSRRHPLGLRHDLRRGAPGSVLPLRSAGRRARVSRARGFRRGCQRPRNDSRPRSGAKTRNQDRLRVHRRRGLRRVRRPRRRGRAASPARAVRNGEARSRGVHPDVQPAARHVARRPALRQRVRAAAGSTR